MTRISELYGALEYGPAPESADRAVEWLDQHGRRFGLFVGGRWVEGAGDATFETLNPASGEPLATATQATGPDIDAAVSAALEAFDSWSTADGHRRARYLYALARGVEKNSRLFAVLESLDNGKPVRESKDLDVPLVARHFLHHAGWAQVMDRELPGRVALGVIGQIIPWNSPLLMLAWKVAPALATGNTVVLKPSELTPLTALLFAELCQEVGLPDGVVNIVTGDGETGSLLVAHPKVDKIAFTGSTAAGRTIRAETAGSGKRLSLELGGKSPFLVFEDSDLDSVVEGVVDAIWVNRGQVCCAGSRILVQEGVAPQLESKLRRRLEKIRMGDSLDQAVDMGAIVAPVQLERIETLVERGVEEGATVWQPSWGGPTKGWFYPPTVCTDVSPASTIAQAESFGPVAVVMTFRTPDEAVRLANDSRYGLAASVWTENVDLALEIAPRLKVGTVWVNCTNLFDATAGFGGCRESGRGREGGREGLYDYVRPAWEASRPPRRPSVGAPTSAGPPSVGSSRDDLPRIDRTAMLYIGGRQVRPDSGYSLPVVGPGGAVVGQVPRGNRKDVGRAVGSARRAAAAWSCRPAPGRAQILYSLAENTAPRSEELAGRLRSLGANAEQAAAEVETTLRRLFTYAAWADKWDGQVHRTSFRNVTLAMPEPLGVLALVSPNEAPLLGFVSLVAPAVAMGNTVVVVPSRTAPLLAIDLSMVLESSDVPGGVVNILTGTDDELRPVLAAHDDIDGMWYFGSGEGSAEVERLSAGNLKRTWVDDGRGRDWFDAQQGEGEAFLREATRIKQIWLPYGA